VTSDFRDRIQSRIRAFDGSTDLSKTREMLDELLAEAASTDPKERKRQRILRVAIDLFVAHGYRRTSIDDVARTAGVAKGTVYLYFKSKADLLVACITAEKARYAGQMQPLLQADIAPATKLRLYLELALKMSADLPLLARLLSGDQELLAVLDDVDEVLGVRTTELQLGFLSALIGEANRGHAWTPDELRERARVLLSLVYIAGHFGDDETRFGLSLTRHGELLADILVQGIAAEAAQSESDRSGGEE
jgi:AcrR family transcriptional regulator